MALVLSLKEGEDVFVDDDRVLLRAVASTDRFEVVSRLGTFSVSDQKMVEVLPDVFMSAGNRTHQGTVRLSIEAPPSKVILRGARYREGGRR